MMFKAIFDEMLSGAFVMVVTIIAFVAFIFKAWIVLGLAVLASLLYIFWPHKQASDEK